MLAKRNGCLCCLLNQSPSLFLVWIVFSLDSLDFLSPFGRTIISRALRVGEYISLVSVQFRAIQWLAYLPFSAQGILIWAQIVDIVVHYISVFPCSSVQFSGWHISRLAPKGY